MINFLSRLVVAGALGLVLAVATALAAQAPSGGAPSNPAEGEGFVNPFEAVESQSLGAVDANLIGLIDQSEAGLPADLWLGANRLVIETLLPRLPAAVGSPAMTELSRRLVLSRAQAPLGATRGVSLVAARLDRALAIGQVGAVEALAEQAPAELDTPPVLAARVDALFYEGLDADACALAERARGRGRDAAWAKRLAFCSALAGNVAEARLSTDVLGDTGAEDEGFTALMAKWVDKAKLKSVTIAQPGAVHFAMLRQTEVALDDATIENAGPTFLTVWSAYTKAPLAQRIAAAELAVSSDTLPASALTSLYLEVKLKSDLLAEPFDPGSMPPGPEGAAYVVQRLAQTSDPVERGQLIAAGLDASRSRGALPAVAGVLRASLTALEAAPTLVRKAATLGAGEIMAGEGVIARRWLDLMRAQGAESSEPGRALRTLLAVRGDVAEFGWTPNDFLSRLNAAGPRDRARADLEWALLNALGTPQTDSIAIAVLGGPLSSAQPSPTPQVIDGLKSAASSGRLGETVLYALIAIGEDGPRGAHPAALSLAVSALARVGLASEARALASEALAWQIPGN